MHDANYVEVLGAFGIAKAFTKGGAERQSYEETIAIFRENLRSLQALPEGVLKSTRSKAADTRRRSSSA